MSDFGLNPSLLPSAKSLIDTGTNDFQGIFAVTPSGKYITGARTIIRINGKLAAFAFSVAWTINTQQDELWTVDDWTPAEFAPKRISVEGTISGFHIPGKSPTALLISPNLLSFLFHKYITIEVRDRTTDNLLFKTDKAVVTVKSESIMAEQMGTLTLQWKAIGWADEKTPAYPQGAEGSSDNAGVSGDKDGSGLIAKAKGFIGSLLK
jgi:hypothetical protein